MHRPARALAAVLLAFAVLRTVRAQAEEGGSGHYTPGANASFVDALPGRPGLAVADAFLYYPSSTSFRLPIAGDVAATLDATTFANSILVIYQTPFEMLGGSYAFGGIVSALWMDLTGTIATGTGTRSGSDSSSGIGDVLLYPFLVGWTAAGGDLKYDVRLGIYAPTGRFEVGSLASVGKNYWTFEPTISVFYVGSKTGFEVSGSAAVDFNTKNQTTDYLTGEQFHVDATVAKRLSIVGGLAGVGASGFYYQQIAGDSGSGATLGDFKGHTLGVGPVASYATRIGSADAAVEIKWLPELDVKNRLEGNLFWFKIRATF